MNTAVLIVGAGGFGRAVCESLRSQPGITVIGYLDDRAGEVDTVDGLPLLGRCDDLGIAVAHGARLVLAIGRNAVRERLGQAAQDAGLGLMPVIDRQAVVAGSAQVGDGCIVMAGAVLGAGVRLGRACIVNYGAVLDHDCRLDDYCLLGAGACLGGGVRLGARTHVREGAVVPAGTQVQAGDALPSPGRQRSAG